MTEEPVNDADAFCVVEFVQLQQRAQLEDPRRRPRHRRRNRRFARRGVAGLAAFAASGLLLHPRRPVGGADGRNIKATDLALTADQVARLDEASRFDVGYPYAFMKDVQGRW